MEIKVYMRNGLRYNFKLDVTFDVDAESQQILMPLILETIREHGIDISDVIYIKSMSIDTIIR